ncbi:MAG: hypothetical protein FIA97_16180 [Methylococcaceae bacterium]|nr:hypothetical protein [Methylococcaceae bacterium]
MSRLKSIPKRFRKTNVCLALSATKTFGIRRDLDSDQPESLTMKPKPYVIDIVDCSDQAGINTCDNLIGHNTVTVRMGGMSNATLKMIDLVINAAEGQYGAIRCLAFWGHGSVDANHKGLGLQYVAGTSESVETRNA